MKYDVFTSFDQGNAQALKICEDVAQIELSPSDDLCFDFSSYGENNPLGNLLIINSLRRCRKRFPNNIMRCIPKDYDGYLSHIGFYKTIGIDVGKQPGEAAANTKYVPITRISLRGEDFYRSIEVKAKQLSNTLRFGNGLQKVLSYMFIETIRNSFEHSEDSSVLIAAQKWPRFDLVEIAIADTGCGVQGSLGKHFAASNEGLLTLACMPGISAGSNYAYLDEDSPWRNSGYGLYILKELSLAYDGSFTLCSGKKAIQYFKADNHVIETSYSTDYEGTAIGLRFRTNRNIDFDQICKDIVEKGQDQAKTINGAIQVASRSSGGRYILDY